MKSMNVKKANNNTAILQKALFVILFISVFLPLVSANDSAQIKFFFTPTCPHCRLLGDYLDGFEQEHPEITVQRIDAGQNTELFLLIQKQYNVPLSDQSAVPKIFFKTQKYCVGDTPCINYLEKEFFLDQNNAEHNSLPPVEQADSQEPVNMVQIFGLALVDSVNPCELAVLIILMTAILSRFPGQKKKALKAGLAFSLAVFLMYFAFGLLIIFGFKTIVGFTQVSSTWFFQLLGGLAILMGLLNIKDAVWYGRGGFVMEVPVSWRPKMKKIISDTTTTLGAFFAGLIVSFFLSPCTAGPYFVAGGILSGLSIAQALPFLLFYLVVFVSPMLAITAIVYFGFSTVEKLSGWREKNIKLLHWIAGLLLLGIGAAMIAGWI